MPNSPKASLVPPLAAPVRLGWCCLRCLTRRGINMDSALLTGVGGHSGLDRSSALGHGRGSLGGGVGAVRAGRAVGTRATARTLATTLVAAGRTATSRRTGPGGCLGLALGAGAGHLALV